MNGADGPVTTFFAGTLNMGWINLFGLIIVVLMLIPNIIYAIKAKGSKNKCDNRIANIAEQIGRYACMMLMVFNFGLAEFGFGSVEAFLIYMIGNAALIIAYWIIWILFFVKPSYPKQILLAFIPACIFLLSGVMLEHYLLIIFAVVFGIAHLYVTDRNRADRSINR